MEPRSHSHHPLKVWRKAKSLDSRYCVWYQCEQGGACVSWPPAIETLWRSAWVLSQHSSGRSKGTFARKPIPSHPHCILVGHRHPSQRPHRQWRQSFVFLSQIYVFPWPRFVLTFLSNLPVVVPNIQLHVDVSCILQMYLIQHSKPCGSSSPGRRIRYLTQLLSSTYSTCDGASQERPCGQLASVQSLCSSGSSFFRVLRVFLHFHHCSVEPWWTSDFEMLLVFACIVASCSSSRL